VGGALITLINNADRVKAACLAQLVNVIGPIMTETGGPAWRQTIFHPFAQASKFGHGNVLRTNIETEGYSIGSRATVPYILPSVVHDEASGAATLFVLNRHSTQEIQLELELRGLGANRKITSATELRHADLKAINSKTAPDAVAPAGLQDISISGENLRVTLKPLSWNVIVTSPS
jgi:alpha-N-arabinofuranosidase